MTTISEFERRAVEARCRENFDYGTASPPTAEELEDLIFHEVESAVWHSYERWGVYGWRQLLARVVESAHGCFEDDWFPPGPRTPIGKNLIREVFERDAYRCQHCGGWDKLSVDHIIPESKGGPTVLENLQALCRSCNSKKGAR